MIRAEFRVTGSGSYKGFSVKGHSGYAEAGSGLVCASVSSAVMLTVNTATEHFGVKLKLKSSDGDIECGVEEITQMSDKLIDSLRAHLSMVAEEFPGYLKVNISEV